MWCWIFANFWYPRYHHVPSCWRLFLRLKAVRLVRKATNMSRIQAVIKDVYISASRVYILVLCNWRLLFPSLPRTGLYHKLSQPRKDLALIFYKLSVSGDTRVLAQRKSLTLGAPPPHHTTRTCAPSLHYFSSPSTCSSMSLRPVYILSFIYQSGYVQGGKYWHLATIPSRYIHEPRGTSLRCNDCAKTSSHLYRRSISPMTQRYLFEKRRDGHFVAMPDYDRESQCGLAFIGSWNRASCANSCRLSVNSISLSWGLLAFPWKGITCFVTLTAQKGRRWPLRLTSSKARWTLIDEQQGTMLVQRRSAVTIAKVKDGRTQTKRRFQTLYYASCSTPLNVTIQVGVQGGPWMIGSVLQNVNRGK